MSDKSAEKSDERSIEDVQAEIDETRQRLTENLSQLKEETTPQALKAKARAAITGLFVDSQTGEVRRERVIAVASVTVGLILVRRGLKSRARKRELRRLAEVVWVPVPRTSVNPELVPVARSAAEINPEPLPALTAA